MVNTDSHKKSSRTGVSRRRFVQAAGASGITVGLAGCLGGDGNGNGNGNGNGEVDGVEDAPSDAIVISADADLTEIEDDIQEALWDAGLDNDIEIAMQAGDFETDSRRDQYTSALEAGRSSPDIFMMDSGWTIPFIVRDQLLNLEENLSSDILDKVRSEYLPSTIDTSEDPETGDLYGLPFFPDFPVMQYRRDLVEDAGYDTSGWDTTPVSWQEFSEIAADVQSQNEDDVDYAFTTQAAPYEGLACCTFNETMSSFGGAFFGGVENLFGPVGDRPVTVEEEPVLETLRAMRAMIHGQDDEHAAAGYEQIAPEAILQWREEEARAPFTDGNAVFHRNWPYSVVINGEDDAFGEDLGTMPLPYGIEESESEYDGLGGSRAALGGWNLAVNPNGDNIEDTLAVLEAFADESVMQRVFELNGNIPPIVSVMEDADRDELGTIGRYVDTLEYAGETTVARPVTDVWPQQAQFVYQEVHDVYTQTSSPEEGMSNLANFLEQTEE
ncbi:extracellular solute-binding protein [Natronocalculus amylovorans]|uniref:Extracellular solute-binding protein n=1 Tax=Natronocalculus amylovorans TaxID=2917812 RepID=A0AAE3FWJ7_9EURY|nr:extracellular solute-binding protein [Natronocalculus amylovorans]MCL9816245.1 extracellular solute-binding protein [Natronocalculus amylovorans]